MLGLASYLQLRVAEGHTRVVMVSFSLLCCILDAKWVGNLT